MSFKRFYINIFIIIFTFFLCVPHVSAASSSVYNYEVLNDLQKDESFDDSKYPAVKNDYSMDVITIGEGKNKELYIYAYQPSHDTMDLEALKISMSTEFREGKEAHNLKIYDLELVSSFSVFDKYKVKDFVISDDEERFYNIVCIYREYQSDIDTTPDATITNAVGYEVGKQWCCYYEDDKLVYEMETFNTMEIEVVLNGEVLFNNGLTLGSIVGKYSSGYCHFIAFDVEDYIVNKIYDADITFTKRNVTTIYSVTSTTNYSEWETVTKYLTDDQEVSYEKKGLISKVYTWDRISKSKSFYISLLEQDIEFSETVSNILNTENRWVFAFYESEYKSIVSDSSSSTGTSTISYEEVDEVVILRIHFKDITGITYDLGVISDITSSDKIPDGVGNPLDVVDDAKDLIKKILQILGLFILGWIIIQVIKILIPKENYSRKRNKK